MKIIFKFINKIKNIIFPLVWEEIKDEEREGCYLLLKSIPVLGLSYIIEENSDGTYTLIKVLNDMPIDITSGYIAIYKAKQAAAEDFSS